MGEFRRHRMCFENFDCLESVKVAGALLSYFSVLPFSAFVDSKSFIEFAIKVNSSPKIFIV